MDPTTNPFAPGAGTQPPELAGRDKLIHDASIALARLLKGRSAKSQLLLGLRGVGKTVLLNRIAEGAEATGFRSITFEAPESRDVAELLVPPLRKLLLQLSRTEKAKEAAKYGLSVLRSFAQVFKLKVGDVEFSVGAATGTADSGNLEEDLPEVMLAATAAAKEAGSGLILCIDEVQYLNETDLAAIIVAVHKLAQKSLPFFFLGAGLPQLAALAGEAKSYSERLFEYPEVGPLPADAARDAIVKPIQKEGADITDEAVARIVSKTQGYPYFLQEWGSHAWNVTELSPITADDVDKATTSALNALDKNFFHARLVRLTASEKRYVRAMAELGPGTHRSGEIADELGVAVTSVSPVRSALIRKGMIFSPQHGDTAFTVPMFDDFIKRTLAD